MKVWSVSPYFGERDVAEIKIGEQGPVVDYHVFLEGNRDHQGRARMPVGLGAHYSGVRYDIFQMPDRLEPWELEGQHRARLYDLMYGLDPDDLVIVSDLDEILSALWIRRFMDQEFTLPAQVAFPIYPYRLDWRWTLPIATGWCRCTVARGSHIIDRGTDGIVKGGKFIYLTEPRAGWHFTYQGTPEQIALKAASIADGWTAKATVEDARRSIATGQDLFGRDRPVEPVPLHELPVYVQRNRARFQHLLRGGSNGQEGSREAAEGTRETVRGGVVFGEGGLRPGQAERAVEAGSDGGD